jgi:hypothetical protein
MSVVKWNGWTDRGTILTTELNSLTDTSRTAVGSEINNGSNKDQYGKVEVQVTFGSNPNATGYLELYAVTAPDGTNYEDGSSSVDPGPHRLVAYIPVRATTSAQRLTSPIFGLEPSKTKFILRNKSGQAFPSSGSTVKLYTTNDEVA